MLLDMYVISDDEIDGDMIRLQFVPPIGTILQIKSVKYRVDKVEVKVADRSHYDNRPWSDIYLELDRHI